MDSQELQQLVARSHDWHFAKTTLRERLRDLQNEIAEVVHHRDRETLLQEIGDAGWSLLQLCNESSADFATLVQNTVNRLDQRRPAKHVCLLGTSANPITNAHLTMGLEILALTNADEVWYYIAGEHPWGKKMMPAAHRLEMTRLATSQYPRLKPCDFDIVHGPNIHATTMETAEILRDHFVPSMPRYSFSWVMGSDVAQTFHQWRGHEWMAENMTVYIIHRLGYDFDKAGSVLKDARHVYFKDNIVTSNISSSLVRERGRNYEHHKLLALVPDVVWNYLEEHRLLDPDVLR